MAAKKILLIEDNAANQLAFRDLLESIGHEVHVVTKAEDGIPLARELKPDLILMDIQLPGMDGLTATRILREDTLTMDIPIIAVSSYAMPGDRERSLVAGCSGYITKPIRAEAFRKEITAILEAVSK